jgi:putative ABC transport system substrate-binding protein
MILERRSFLTFLGVSAAAAWPLAARAQQPRMPVIGFLSSASHQTMEPEIAGFLQGLRETGYTEGRNIAIEYRWGAGQLERMPVLAAELVDRPVAVLFSHTELAIVAARAATTTIPIVFRTGADPVRAGYVASLNRPRGNLTGVTSLGADLGPKRLGLLHELVPTGTVIAVLVDQNFPDGVSQLMGLQEAARSVNRQTIVLNARTASDIDTAFATLVQQHAGALTSLGGNFFNTRNEQIVTLAARYAIPAIYDRREFPAVGGLMSYGPDRREVTRQAGIYVARILKGDKPGDLPVQQPTKFEFIINLRTAKALKLNIPPGILAIADEVIE